MSGLKNLLLTEQYRPNSLETLIFEKKETLKQFLLTPTTLPSFVFVSKSPGTGKTSTAKIISNLLGCDTLLINSSDERGIDTIREKIKLFAQSLSMVSGAKRLIFLDEADGLTRQAQDSLRNLMETYSDNCFFILSCNDLNKIIEPIQSRCKIFNFDKPDKAEILERLKFICINENIKITDTDLTNIIDVCYSSDTEILTENGWILIKDIVDNKLKVKVATLNPEKNVVEYHYPLKYYKFNFSDKMLHIKNKNIDLLISPNHKLWIKKPKKEFKFTTAKHLNVKNYYQYRGFDFTPSQKINYFLLPPYKNNWKAGNKYHTKRTIIKPELKIKIEDWLGFFGLWISEGFLGGGRYVIICQSIKNLEKITKIKQALSLLPFKIIETKPNKNNIKLFVICSKQLWIYLKQFGKAKDKYIPREIIKKINKEQCKILLKYLILGDGNISNNGTYSYYSSSEKLLNNVQELAFKAGWIGFMEKGGVYISTRKTAKYFRNEKENKWEEYSGNIYDLTVKNHLLFVRRNGQCCWSGNCYPDIRKCIMFLQSGSIEGCSMFDPYTQAEEMKQLIYTGNINKIYEIVYSGNFDLIWFTKYFFKYIYNNFDNIGLDKCSKISLLLADILKSWQLNISLEEIFLANITEVIKILK